MDCVGSFLGEEIYVVVGLLFVDGNCRGEKSLSASWKG